MNKTLANGYRTRLRPFLELNGSKHLAVLDNLTDQLDRTKSRDQQATVCFLGNCAVGKSTLLNALIGEGTHILPSGGIGPMTALATTVRFGNKRRFEVTYHKKAALWRIGFTLERKIAVRRGKDSESKDSEGKDFEQALSPSEQEVAESAIEFDHAQEGDGTSPIEGMALQIVTGRQYRRDDSITEEYLADGIRLACGLKPRWTTVLAEEDRVRVESVGSKINENSTGKSGDASRYVREEDGNLDAFLRDIEAHTVGYLAPIIDQFDIQWPAEILRSGVVLVDLPGVGVASDRYKDVTHKFVKQMADAVVLVVNRAGVTDASLSLLRSSGYWDRLVGSVDNLVENGCALLLAVTHVDNLAQTEWDKGKLQPKDQRRKKHEIYQGLVENLQHQLLLQSKQQFKSFAAAENAAVKEAQDGAIGFILDHLRVHPVCATEHAKIVSPDEEDRPFLTTEEQTGIPGLRREIEVFAANHRARIAAEASAVEGRLHRALDNELQLIKERHAPRTVWAAVTERFQKELDSFFEGRRRELDVRKGMFGGYLKQTSKELITAYVAEARAEAQISVRRFLGKMKDYHWTTLRAAVRRGGTWLGGSSHPVCIPDDIADRFQEPMAGVWSVKLLAPLRDNTKQYADDVVRLVREVHAWAAAQTDLGPTKSLLSKQAKQIAEHAEQMRDIGKDAVSDLRKTVKDELYKIIKPPIEAECAAFRRRGDDIGPGVKRRILELFDTLAENATTEAVKPAKEILTRKFRVVEKEIMEAFAKMGEDPLSDARDVILQKHEKSTNEELKQHQVVVDACDAYLLEVDGETPGSRSTVAAEMVQG